MISNCPLEIAGWSDDGNNIIIKDIKHFSENILPRHYKHSHFTSFVRQLNFYGFRKQKTSDLQQANWWIFRHPQFLRDRPQLIGQIKRSMHFAGASAVSSSSDTSHSEVTELKIKLDNLQQQMDYIMMEMKTFPDISQGPDVDLDWCEKNILPEWKKPRYSDPNSDPGFNVSLESFDWSFDECYPQANRSEAIKNQLFDTFHNMGIENNKTIQEISSVMSILSPELKERFVDKLAEELGKQLATAELKRSSLSNHLDNESSANRAFRSLDKIIQEGIKHSSDYIAIEA